MLISRVSHIAFEFFEEGILCCLGAPHGICTGPATQQTYNRWSVDDEPIGITGKLKPSAT